MNQFYIFKFQNRHKRQDESIIGVGFDFEEAKQNAWASLTRIVKREKNSLNKNWILINYESIEKNNPI